MKAKTDTKTEPEFITTLQGFKTPIAKDVTIDEIIKRAWKYHLLQSNNPQPNVEPEITGFFVHPMDSKIWPSLGMFEFKIKGEFELKLLDKEAPDGKE